MVEARAVEHRAGLQAAPVGDEAVQQRLRHPLVRRRDRGQRVLQGLVLGDPDRRVPVGLVVGDERVLRQDLVRRPDDGLREVDEVVVVGHAVVVDPAGEARGRRVLVADRGVVAAAVELPVLRDDVVDERAAHRRLQEAELVLEQHPALRHHARRDRVVVVGRDVPVVRRADVGAERRTQAEARSQEARAPPVADGKAEDRRGEDRHALEVQPRRARRGGLLQPVELDLFGLDPPRVVAGRAGREARLAHPRLLVAEELDQRCVAARSGAAHT